MRQSGGGINEKIILSMGAGLIDNFIRNILSVPFCPYYFVHTILSNTILSAYHFVHTILSVPFCPIPFCPVTPGIHGRPSPKPMMHFPLFQISPSFKNISESEIFFQLFQNCPNFFPKMCIL